MKDGVERLTVRLERHVSVAQVCGRKLSHVLTMIFAQKMFSSDKSNLTCPKRQSCKSTPHCWIDPEGQHYKMNAKHLTALVEYVAHYGMLKTHSDVPQHLQDKLRMEEHERRRKQAPRSDPTIHITNVLPDQYMPQAGVEQSRLTCGDPSNTTQSLRLEDNGFLDDELQDYATWQQSRVRHPKRKAEIDKALDVWNKHNFDLGLLLKYNEPDFLYKADVSLGTARRLYCPEDILDFNRWKRPRAGP